MKLKQFIFVLVTMLSSFAFTANAQVAKVGNTEYATIDEAIANWTNGTTLTLLADVTLSDVIKLSSTEYHILDLGTYTMTAGVKKNSIFGYTYETKLDAIEIVNNGRSSASYALDITADATNPGGITASGKAVVKTTGKSGVQDRPIIRFYGGVFNGSNVVSHSGSNGTNCPQFWFYGGEFNGTISANRAKFLFYGGTFNGTLSISVDSNADALVCGGKFKKLSNSYGSALNTDKFTIGSAAGVYDRGIYVDAEGYYVITSAPITEVSAKYPAVKKESYNSNNYFYYSAANTYGMFYEVASMAGTGSNVTVWEKPAVTIPETLTGEAVEEIRNNTALDNYTPANLPSGAELEIELKSVGETIVYDVTPMANGTKVEPTNDITFRLPVPASVTETYAKVYHESELMGVYAIQGEGNAKYVEISSANFSVYTVEPVSPVAKIGDVKYATLAEAVAAAQSGDEIVMLADVTLDAATTLPAGITFNGNGKQINGTIVAAGDITFAGVTKAGDLDFAVGNTVVNIPAGASLQLNGSARMSIGFGTTFNIVGTIEDAKTADKASLTPSLVMPGASFSGAGVKFNVTNAYISVPSSYCSTSKSASGTFDFNITNSIWDSAGKLAFEEQSVNAKVDFALVNSVLTTGSHLVFGTASGDEGVVIDNSNVNVGKSNQLENCGTMTVKNGSVVNGAVATSSNAKNPGIVIVENATYAVTGEFSGSDLGTGTLIIKKGATVSAGSITKANIVVDATDMTAGELANFTANLANFAGTLSVINNDKLEAKIVDGKIVLAAKPVAKIGDVEFGSLQAAIDAAENGATINVICDVKLKAQNAQEYFKPAYNRESYCGIVIPDDKAVTLDLNGKTVSYEDAYGDVDNVMVMNLGNLTINDAVGGGKLTYKPVAGEKTYTYFYSTIFNCGTLTINAGTVENTAEAETDVTNAVDNHSRLSHEYGNDCVLTVNGGTLSGAYYYAIRQYTHYLEGVQNRVVINGGDINGGVYMQHGDSWYYANAESKRLNVDCFLTINGGNINVNTTPDAFGKIKSRLSNPDNNVFGLAINGGNINVPVELLVQRGVYYTNGVSGATTPAETAGTRNAEWLEKNGGFVKGGTFADAGSADDVTSNLASFVDASYKLIANADNTFSVVAKPSGSVTPAFTGATSIWGEGGGNAKESFVVKLYSGETLLATASLNNIGGIIDGDVYVSWNIPLNAAGNDEYWNVVWSNYVTAETMPTKVVMVIDGEEVAENNFQLNSPDDLNKIYAAVADAEGKFTQFSTTLAAAVNAAQAGQTVVLLKDAALGETTIAKSITINGNGHKVTPADANKTYNSAFMVGDSGWGDNHGETITLNNIKFEGWKTNYGVVRAQGVTLAMDGCEFNGNSVSNAAYAVLSLNYTAANVANTKFVENTSRAIDVNYNGDSSQALVTVDGCTFEGNTTTGAGIVMRSKGTMAVKNSIFKNNTVNTNGNGATVYVGFGAGNMVSGCTFTGNTVTTSHTSTKRFASAIFCDGCIVSKNVFGEGNTATRNNEAISTIVAVGAYYGAADLSANYWGGNAPVAGTDYTVEYSNNDVAFNSYYTDANLTNEVTLANAAKVGKYYYATIEEAVAAVKEGETITILAGTHSEGTVKLPATLKNVTIKGVEGTILKDMTISAADGNSYSYIGLTFDGITFDNSRILLTGWRNGEETIENLTVTNCTFKNLYDTTNTAPIHINKDAAEAVNGFTFTNNVIDGATGGSKSGIYAQVTGNVVVENNVINNVSFRPYVIQVTTDDGIADNFTVTGNTFSGSAVGRAQGLGNNAEGTDAVNLVVSNNIFKGITDAQQICYWGFNTATTTADLSKNYYDIDILANPGKIYYNSAAESAFDLVAKKIFPIYTELNEDGTINTNSAYSLTGGTWGGIDWTLTNDGTLTIAPTKGTPTTDNSGKWSYEVGQWPEAVKYNNKGVGVDVGLWPYDRSKVKTLIIEEGVTSIGSFTAQGFTNLEGEVVIPYTVKYIGQEAFQKSTFSKITFAPVPEGKTGEELCIAQGALKNLVIEEITFPEDRPVHLHAWMFANSNNLKHVTLPATIKSINGTTHVDYNHNPNQTTGGGANTSDILGKCPAVETITFGSQEVRDLYYNPGWTRTDAPIVVNVGLKSYKDFRAGIDAAQDGETVLLLGNVTLDDTWTIPAGMDLTLNLNGKTISHSKACTASYEMINNKGNLNIVGSGKISFTDTSAGDPNFGWGSYTVRNEGNLVVEKATIEHKGAQAFGTHMICAIFQYCGSTTINGGTISTPNYRSARLWKGEMTINGGTFDGQLWVQAVDNSAKLTINNGTFEPNGQDASAVFVTNSDHNVQLAVANGTFKGKIGCSDATKLAGAITGGKFTEAAKENTNAELLVVGSIFGTEADENGYFTLVDDPCHIKNLDELKAFAADVNAGNSYAGKTVRLGADIDLNNEEWAPIGSDKDHAFKGVFDGQDYTISNLKIENYDLDCAGLFGYATGATVKNVKVKNVNIKAYSHVAPIVGHMYTGDIENCHVSGTINLVAQYAYAAGITADGYVDVRDCSVIAEGTGVITVKEKTGAGGITGWRGEGNLVIKNCTVKNLDITAWASLGGITGIAQYNNVITGCTVENVKLTKTRENGQASIGLVSGNWTNKADDNYTITITNNNFDKISINGTAITSLYQLYGSNYSYYDKVIKLVEEGNTYGENIVTNVNVVVKTLDDLKKAIAYVKAGDEINLGADIEATEVLMIGKSLTINGNGHKIISNATRVFRVTASNIEVTLDGVNMVSRTVMTYPNDIRGISIDPSLENIKLTLNNCSVDFTDASACDWAYAVNVSGNGTGHTVTVNGGSYEGANVINAHGANNTIVVKDATLTSLYPNADVYYGACIWVLQNQGSTVEATGNIFNGSNAVAFNLGNGTALTESDNTDNTTRVVAKIGNHYYTTLEAAFKAATSGCTIDILSDVTVDYAWDARYTGSKFTVPVTINGNGKTIKFTASVNDNNYQAPFRFEADATVKNLTVDMSEATDSRFRAISSKGNLTVDGCTFIGKDETLNCRAIIFGEGAGANVGNLAISVTNSKFINWKRGISDNENGQDVKTATITGNTLENAAVYVSAYETVTFTGNTVEGAYVDLRSYTANNSLNVTATGNTLEENTETAYNYIKNAGGTVVQEGFMLPAVAKSYDADGNKVASYSDFESAIAAAAANASIARIEVVSDYVQKSIANTTDYYEIKSNLVIAAPEGKNYTVKGCGFAVKVQGAKLTIANNLTVEGLDVVANGFATSGDNMVIDGTVKALSLKQWTSNGTITVNGKVELGYGDGQFDMAYGNGNVVVNGNGDKTVAQFKAGYSGTRGNGGALTLNNTYFEAGAWFTVAGSNTTINVNNSLLKVSGGDAAGSLTLAAGNTINLDINSQVVAATITGAGVINIDAEDFDFDGGDVTVIKANMSGFAGAINVTGKGVIKEVTDAGVVIKADPNYLPELNLLDGSFPEDFDYANYAGKTVGEFTYQRNISEYWSPMYLPFPVSVESLHSDIEIAYINGVRREDGNNDGELTDDEGFVMELIYIRGGNANGEGKTLKANYPYFVRCKNKGGNAPIDVAFTDIVLSEILNKVYDCTTMNERFAITGNYNTTALTANSNYYMVGADTDTGKAIWSNNFGSAALLPFRFHLTVTDRDDAESPVVVSRSMSIAVRGEELPDGTTLIYDVEAENNSENMIFDLSGRRVLEAENGVYIINGKKVLVK